MMTRPSAKTDTFFSVFTQTLVAKGFAVTIMRNLSGWHFDVSGHGQRIGLDYEFDTLNRSERDIALIAVGEVQFAEQQLQRMNADVEAVGRDEAKTDTPEAPAKTKRKPARKAAKKPAAKKPARKAAAKTTRKAKTTPAPKATSASTTGEQNVTPIREPRKSSKPSLRAPRTRTTGGAAAAPAVDALS